MQRTEFEEAKFTEEESQLVWFVSDLKERLKEIDRQVGSESAHLLMTWILDEISQLQDEYHENI